ncbi:hypothetical protein BKA81DRAFT_363005 [Phyllosticta paracitricarpa]|uniref:Uncharacterized protein n=1 Tax=Phyllosticta citricarpa TaxID=55181 RepID=A0ABR1LIH5_9PEZI
MRGDEYSSSSLPHRPSLFSTHTRWVQVSSPRPHPTIPSSNQTTSPPLPAPFQRQLARSPHPAAFPRIAFNASMRRAAYAASKKSDGWCRESKSFGIALLQSFLGYGFVAAASPCSSGSSSALSTTSSPPAPSSPDSNSSSLSETSDESDGTDPLATTCSGTLYAVRGSDSGCVGLRSGRLVSVALCFFVSFDDDGDADGKGCWFDCWARCWRDGPGRALLLFVVAWGG